jgi:hypothetical protein
MKKKFKLPFTTDGPPTIIENMICYMFLIIIIAASILVIHIINTAPVPERSKTNNERPIIMPPGFMY